jgi:DNA-binding PadR family transcriptional regulator
MIDVVVLALLREGPDYAYHLGRRLEERLGPAWRVSQGQLCRSLERLRRRGLAVEIAAPFQRGRRRRRFFEVTPRGRQALERWLGRPPALRRPARDELVVRLLLLAPERAATLVPQLTRLAELCARRIEALAAQAASDDPVRRLALEAVRLQTEAQRRWIETCLASLRPGQGGEGHAAGAGVFGCATKSPGRSCAAVEGGLPLALAGAAAHQEKGPRKRSTAMLPCRGSSSV